MAELTKLHLTFSQTDHASVFFAHLQNLMLDLHQQPNINSLLIDKIDKVLFDIYNEHFKLQKDHIETTTNLKNMLTQCNEIIQSCKNDREELVKATQDRYDIMEKLKASTNDSLQYLTENQNLKEAMRTMQQLNKLLVEKHECLEDQIKNLEISNQGNHHLGNLKTQYDTIFNNNNHIRQELADLITKTQFLEKASIPLQIISFAFESNKSLKQLVWQQVEREKGGDFSNREQLKSQFIKFNYKQLIKQFK